MHHRSVFFASVAVSLGIAIAVAACKGGGGSVDDDGRQDGAAPVQDGGGGGPIGFGDGAFNPADFPKTCATASDCIIAPIINRCSSCCGSNTAVNRAASEEALRNVERQCAGNRAECTMFCEPREPQCNDGTCEACTSKTCEDGIHVQIPFPSDTTAFTMKITATTNDGVSASCTLSRLSTGGEQSDCAIAFPPTPGTSKRLWVKSTTATDVTIRIEKNDVETVNRTLPVTYGNLEGPNGARCEPKTCKQAILNNVQ